MNARREIGEYLAEKPLGDEQISDEDMALVLFIATHAAQHGYPPSLREVARARGMSYSAVCDRVERLARLRVLRWEPRQRRTLRVVGS